MDDDEIRTPDDIVAAQVTEFQNRAKVFRRYFACLTAEGFTEAQAMRLIVAFQVTLDRK